MTGLELHDVLIYWLGFGIVLMLVELVLPGGISFAFGLSAVVVSLLAWSKAIDSWLGFLATWVLLSGGMLAVFVPLAQRYFGGKQTRAVLDDDMHALGTEVDVVQDVAPDHDQGKIRYQGSLWSARSTVGPLPAGSRARLVRRDGFVWVVELLAEPMPQDGSKQPPNPHESSKQSEPEQAG